MYAVDDVDLRTSASVLEKRVMHLNFVLSGVQSCLLSGTSIDLGLDMDRRTYHTNYEVEYVAVSAALPVEQLAQCTGVWCVSVRGDTNSEAIFVLAKRNYKLYANIGVTTCSTNRFVAILHTGAGSSFIGLNEIPRTMRKHINKPNDQPEICNASGKVVPIVGTMYLIDQIGTSTELFFFPSCRKTFHIRHTRL